MKEFLANFPFRGLSVFVTIVGSFTYNVFLERDVACTCKDVAKDCILYMVLPFLIFFLLILWTDKTFQKTSRYTFACKMLTEEERAMVSKCCNRWDCSKCCDFCKCCNNCCFCSCCNKCNCFDPCCRIELCGVFITRILKAGCVGALWVASVLIDGDWYVCCKSVRSQLACKDETSITAEENAIINTLKNTSRRYGFLVLLGIIGLSALMSLCDWRRCCEPCCRRRAVYDRVILEEGEHVLKETFRETTKDELTKRFFEITRENGENWIKCLDIAAVIVKEPEGLNHFQPPIKQDPDSQQQGSVQAQATAGTINTDLVSQVDHH